MFYILIIIVLLIPTTAIVLGLLFVWDKLPKHYFWLLLLVGSSLVFFINKIWLLIGTVFLIPLLILITVVIGLYHAWKKMPKHHFFLLLMAIIISPFLIFKFYERRYTLSYVPDALQVSSISYDNEKSWGFGPGGNEAGIVVYPLSEQVAHQISQQGIKFFNTLPDNIDQEIRDWRGDFGPWSRTPVIPDKQNWSGTEGKLNIYDYICAYGFCIDIDKAVEKQATEIVNSKGNYYAYGRIGLIVVSPQKKVVLFMFNG